MKYIFAILLCFIVCRTHAQVTDTLLTGSAEKANNSDLDFIKQHITGIWKDSCSSTTVFKKRRYSITYDSSKIKDYGTWKIKANQLILYSDLFPIVKTYDILYFSPDMFKIRLVLSKNAGLCIYNRIK